MIIERIADRIQFSYDVFVLDFDVRQGGEATGAPIDQSIISIEQSIFVESNEDLADGLGQTLIHRKPLTTPITGGSQSFQLLNDGTAGLGFPLPHPLDEGVAAQHLARSSFRH